MDTEILENAITLDRRISLLKENLYCNKELLIDLKELDGIDLRVGGLFGWLVKLTSGTSLSERFAKTLKEFVADIPLDYFENEIKNLEEEFKNL